MQSKSRQEGVFWFNNEDRKRKAYWNDGPAQARAVSRDSTSSNGRLFLFFQPDKLN
jgi:hypothetical protein